MGERAAYRFHVPKLYKPIIPDRCRTRVSEKHGRVTLSLHKYDNFTWRFLKG